LTTTCNKNEQQQDGKNNTESLTKLTKTKTKQVYRRLTRDAS